MSKDVNQLFVGPRRLAKYVTPKGVKCESIMDITKVKIGKRYDTILLDRETSKGFDSMHLMMLYLLLRPNGTLIIPISSISVYFDKQLTSIRIEIGMLAMPAEFRGISQYTESIIYQQHLTSLLDDIGFSSYSPINIVNKSTGFDEGTINAIVCFR